ncbi:class I SAM-dependent methyltransferase [Saccharospirillum mangrovi]|uniref:class I SAM-dependent methyltransferase n=1 Tax=Saccharospirillum mangrovi TaxID=2161747 RepID=UPI000D3C408E|nr:class I SAM-dependent methyltransferase [Saccharospirillum mangrovi]
MAAIPVLASVSERQQLHPQTQLALAAADVRWLDEVPDGLYLRVDDGMLGLVDAQQPKQTPVMVDFTAGKARHRQQFGGGRSQAIAKAVGLHQRAQLTVIDATAGLGQDAFVLASLGAQVRLLERHPWVQLLLGDGLARAQTFGIEAATRMELLSPQSSLASIEPAEIVYLDPMFPEGPRKAAVKKPMALFQQLVGADDDADALLAPALAQAQLRVVVKRPRLAPVLAGQAPTYALTGKSNRFDIYALRSINAG